MNIQRSKEKDSLCMKTCTNYEQLHALDCPYTKERWRMQGVYASHVIKVPTPKEIRDGYKV